MSTRPAEWRKPAGGSWHLLREDGRAFCGRLLRDDAARRTREAPRVHGQSGYFITADGSWPAFSCWGCMDAYAPWAIRKGFTGRYVKVRWS